jgi:DNA polymerase III subunit gamma/tau
MKYQVIARKFRPQVFSEVVGQKLIVQTLQNAIKLNRTGHAYLFCGPRGVGKTTMARILAKGLNCLQGPTIEPCNECPSCREIAAGQSMDVLEIDAASNTGVDNVRELRDSARYAPSRDRNKIFIIDEVHMLSTSAFNALLKILEEPPAHVIFIMATTERQKLPATILSRCLQFAFRTIAPAEIQAHLKKIVEREGAQIDDAGLSYIVKASEGSMRDAQSLLDQIISFGGETVDSEDVRDVLGFIPTELLDRAIDAIASSNSQDLIETVAIVVDQGLGLQQFVRELIARTRDLLMMKLGLEDKVLGSDSERTDLRRRAEAFSEQDLIRYFDLLLRLENDLRWTSQPRFHLEVGLVKLAKAGHMRDIEEVLRDLKQEPPSQAAPGRSAPTSPASRTATPPSKPSPQRSEPRAAAIVLPSVPSMKPATPMAAASAPATQRIDRPEVSAPPEAMESRPASPVRKADDASLSSAREEPLVKRFLEVFRGDIAQVKPPKGETP